MRLSLAFVAVQTAIGLLAQSSTVYLAAPVLVNAAWGLVFLVSIVVGRPLAATLANAWYPFPTELRELRVFRRIFAVESLVWGFYCLARAGLRLGILLTSGVGGFVLVSVATGTPVLIALVAWGSGTRGAPSSASRPSRSPERRWAGAPA